MRSGERTTCIFGIHNSDRLDKHGVALAVGDRAMLDPLRDIEQLTLAQSDVSVAQLDGQLAINDQKQLVSVIMGVPHKLALNLHNLDIVFVQSCNNLRRQMVGTQ